MPEPVEVLEFIGEADLAAGDNFFPSPVLAGQASRCNFDIEVDDPTAIIGMLLFMLPSKDSAPLLFLMSVPFISSTIAFDNPFPTQVADLHLSADGKTHVSCDCFFGCAYQLTLYIMTGAAVGHAKIKGTCSG